jgi:serine/threonine-protein kinase
MQRTRVGQIKGKVPYMAPEQAVGDDVDRRSDVFALGIVLYQLVTGRHPFRTDSEYATLARIRDKNPAESARTHAPDVPAAVDEVMLRAIAKNREDRFATMAELSRALERALPTSPDTDRELGAFVASLLSKRAERRGQAIREALAAVRGAAPGRPLRTTQRLLFDEPAESIPRGGPSRSIAPPAPTAPPSSTRAPESSPRASTAPVSGASDEETPDFRPRSRRLLLIATGTVLLLALAAGIAIGMR